MSSNCPIAINRRRFIHLVLLGTAHVISGLAMAVPPGSTPPCLERYTVIDPQNPKQAALSWFRDARFGLFIHYGLYSLDGIHPFEQLQHKIPVREYERKMDRFTAENFDAEAICDLAVEAGMKYVTFVTKHCDGFCLWNTKQTDYNSVRSAAKRDLVAEMIKACNSRGLGFFAFYEYGFEWHHPHGPRRTDFPTAITEVSYPQPDPSYAYGNDYDVNRYIDFAQAQIEELLTTYGPIAGIWLDGIAAPISGDRNKFRCQELYDKIHRLQPHALVSFKFGVTGTEDFLAPESQQLRFLKSRDSKMVEMCDSLNPSWGHVKKETHHDADWVWQRLAFAREHQMNFLLNIGPLPDGSVSPADRATLKEIGRRIREQGWPSGVKSLSADKNEQEAF